MSGTPTPVKWSPRIPPEILNEIFKFACDLEREHVVNTDGAYNLWRDIPSLSRSFIPQMYILRHVCRFWRDVIDGNSVFWRQIRINSGTRVTADNQAHLNFLFDHSGHDTVLHLYGSLFAGIFPVVRWSQVRHLRVTSNLWRHLVTALASAVNLDHLEFSSRLFFTHRPANAVILQRSIKRVTLTSLALLEALQLPSLVELNVDMCSIEPGGSDSLPLGSALARFQCRLTTLRIREDKFPLHISNTELTRGLGYLRFLVIDYENNHGVGSEEYNEVVTGFVNILRVTSETGILPSLEDTCLTVKTNVEQVRPRIRTLNALLAMLHSRVGGMKAFGIHAFIASHSNRYKKSAVKLSAAFPPIKVINDLIQFRAIDIKMTSNGENIFG